MSDILEKLRWAQQEHISLPFYCVLCEQAADEIERLRAQYGAFSLPVVGSVEDGTVHLTGDLP